MKGLSLTPPWGTLIALGAKTIETRSWPTRYRGRLAIHQTTGLGDLGGEADLTALCSRDPFRAALMAPGCAIRGSCRAGRSWRCAN